MKSRYLSNWAARLLADRPVRANSLIITVYGDAVAPHGGSVWLGSFINLVGALGLNPRMVRTSVFRLSREDWLESRQVGRRSYYSLTSNGRRRFEQAYRRIYDIPRTEWNGEWQLVLAPGNLLSSDQREALRKELLWQGFGAVAPGVFAHPTAIQAELDDILRGTGTRDGVVALEARTLDLTAGKSLQQLVREVWNLAAVADHYRRFIDRFRPVLKAMEEAESLDPEQCFVVRTLLIHEFRRVQLRDPQLPAPLLPAQWPGDTARRICRDIYRLAQQGAERHLMSVLESADGSLPEAAPYFYQRFGGILSANHAQPGQ